MVVDPVQEAARLELLKKAIKQTSMPTRATLVKMEQAYYRNRESGVTSEKFMNFTFKTYDTAVNAKLSESGNDIVAELQSKHIATFQQRKGLKLAVNWLLAKKMYVEGRVNIETMQLYEVTGQLKFKWEVFVRTTAEQDHEFLQRVIQEEIEFPEDDHKKPVLAEIPVTPAKQQPVTAPKPGKAFSKDGMMSIDVLGVDDQLKQKLAERLRRTSTTSAGNESQ
jgi:hypothetical protein